MLIETEISVTRNASTRPRVGQIYEPLQRHDIPDEIHGTRFHRPKNMGNSAAGFAICFERNPNILLEISYAMFRFSIFPDAHLSACEHASRNHATA